MPGHEKTLVMDSNHNQGQEIKQRDGYEINFDANDFLQKCQAAISPLINLDQWIPWKAGKPDAETGKFDKIPCNVHTGQNATGSHEDGSFLQNCGSYEQAVQASEKFGFDGVGFVLTKGDPIVGIDVDGCLHNGGDPGPTIEIIERLDTYVEISPSGTGLRFFCLGKLPDNAITNPKNNPCEIYDSKRFLTVTLKPYGGFPKPVVENQDGINWFCENRTGLKESSRILTLSESAGLDPDTILEGVPDGERDTTLFKYASRLRELNYSRKEAEILILHAATKCTPPFAADTALKKVQSAWKYEPGVSEQTVQADLWDRPFDLNSVIDKDAPEIKWLFFKRIPLGRGGLTTGVGGTSKTQFIKHCAVGVATGRLPWEWEVSTTGKSLLVLTEDTEEDVHMTLDNMTRGLNLTDDEKRKICELVTVYPLAGIDIRLLAKSKTGSLVKTDLFFALAEKIKSLEKVVFVGLDPALSLTDGDELDQGNQRALGKMADDLAVTTGATCMLVTHAAKNSLMREELSSHNSRGGGAITDAVRAEYSLRTMTANEAAKAKIEDLEERKRHVQLVATKGNNLPPSAFVPVWLRRDDFGLLHQADIKLDGSGLCKDDLDSLDILKDLSSRATPSLSEWRQACVEEGTISGQKDTAQVKSMQRTISKLLSAGLITRGHGKGIYTPTVLEEG